MATMQKWNFNYKTAHSHGFFTGVAFQMETSDWNILNLKHFFISHVIWIFFSFLSFRKWFVPSFVPYGTRIHKKSALRTTFIKEGDAYVVSIELKDPKIHAIEFVLKDTRHDKWFIYLFLNLFYLFINWLWCIVALQF